ncbi:MAG: carboxypeptidase regulatory-like domain-containing protein [Gemmatimonadales bacterium]|jgi:hypothetical protein
MEIWTRFVVANGFTRRIGRPGGRRGRRTPAFAGLVALCAALAGACSDDPTGPGPEPIPEASTGEVTGTVRAAGTGPAVAGAVVSIGTATDTTGQDGRYRLTDLPTGPTTIRASATGFADFELTTSIPDYPVTRDVSLVRMEKFEFGDFALYAPAGYRSIRGVIVALGGPDTRGFVTGGPFGAPVPEVEAALATFGGRLRSLAGSTGLAVLGTSLAGLDNAPSSDEALAEALRAAAIASGRPELVDAPILFYGISGGGPEASGFTARNPARVVGLFLKVPAAIDPDAVVTALDVPAYVVQAELDAFVDNGPIDASFAAIRQAGGLWAKVLEPGVPHHSFSTAQRTFTLDWMRKIVELRMPTTAGGSIPTLGPASGWLGGQVNHDIAAWADYAGAPADASWLPSELTAEQWQSLGAVRGSSGATISFVAKTATVSVGRTIMVPVRVFDGSGAKIEGAVVTYSVNPTDVAIPWNDTDYCEWYYCRDAVVSGMTPGLATVTAAYEGATDELEVNVVAATGSIVVSPAASTLGVGATIIVKATLRDGAGNEIPNLPGQLYWLADGPDDTWGVQYVRMSDVPGTNGWEQEVTGLTAGTIYLRPWYEGPVGPDPQAYEVAIITIE